MKLTATIQVSVDMALDLIESRSYPKGVTLLVYRPGGRPEYTRDVA